MSTTIVEAAFRSRLTQVIHSFGSVVSLAKEVGVSDNAIYKWLSGRGQPSVTNLVALARAGRVSVEWLATGSEPAGGATARAAEHGDYIFMPRMKTRSARGREGMIHSEHVVDSIAFRAEWVRRSLKMEPRDLILLEAAGDAMAPTIEDSDLMLVNVGEPRFRQDGIYLLKSDDGMMVKRIQRRPDGKMVLRSDNPKYDSMVVTAVKVIGRIVWIGGRA